MENYIKVTPKKGRALPHVEEMMHPNQVLESKLVDIDELNASVMEGFNELRALRRDVEAYCDKHFGHEYDERDGYYACINCKKINPLDPEDYLDEMQMYHKKNDWDTSE